MIQFRGVSKTYPNNVTALRNVNLAIDKGEFVFIVGPSGAGKSTLVKCIYRGNCPPGGRSLSTGAT